MRVFSMNAPSPQEAKPAGQSREVAHEQIAGRDPFWRTLVAKPESWDVAAGMREGFVGFRGK